MKELNVEEVITYLDKVLRGIQEVQNNVRTEKNRSGLDHHTGVANVQIKTSVSNASTYVWVCLPDDYTITIMYAGDSEAPTNFYLRVDAGGTRLLDLDGDACPPYVAVWAANLLNTLDLFVNYQHSVGIRELMAEIDTLENL